jgi:flagellar L-ring protein precursor FlgH
VKSFNGIQDMNIVHSCLPVHPIGAAGASVSAGMVRPCAVLAALVLALLAGGCAQLAPPRVEMADTRPVRAEPTPAPFVQSGSLFQSHLYRPLFEDHRARLVGDTLTVNIVERVSAAQSSSSSIDKSGSLEAGISALPFLPASGLARLNSRMNAAAESNNNFAGSGSTENTNDFSGTITVIVTGVLPNGHLLVAGEKQIGVNSNVDVLRFSGQIDPRNIQAGNAVPSTRVANVRVEHRGRGAQADANTAGWLSRFFLSVWPI